ncbi:MAG: hypothetical protein GWP08_14365 [Nitrospiraceae bacterium]|nr:hypothetical protein [Nitrospiraceae bacterium]
MRIERRPVGAHVLGLCLAAVLLAGCQTTRVEALPGRYTIGLTADDTVGLLRHAGLSDTEIVEEGTDLRNSLASQGSARIMRGKDLVAMFVVRGEEVIVSTGDGKRFVYQPAESERPAT